MHRADYLTRKHTPLIRQDAKMQKQQIKFFSHFSAREVNGGLRMKFFVLTFCLALGIQQCVGGKKTLQKSIL